MVSEENRGGSNFLLTKQLRYETNHQVMYNKTVNQHRVHHHTHSKSEVGEH
jgi:hypothetical protein